MVDSRYSGRAKSVADLHYTNELSLSAEPTIILEGYTKFRDGKKWRNRWCVLSRLSPAADCLQLQFYKDERERARNGHTKASLSLQNFFCIETGFTLDKESQTLAIITQDLNVVLAFESRERLIQWSARIVNNLGEFQQFLVQLASAPVKSKLTPGPAKLNIIERRFCLTGGIPPKLLGFWDICHLRRYGVMEGRLIFEGGSRCGRAGEGVHVLIPDQSQISSIIEALDSGGSSSSSNSKDGHRSGGNTTGSAQVRSSSSRRTCSVDSPRRMINPRLIESRPGLPSSEESLAMSGPRESRSAEELCKTDLRGNRFNGSRCELDDSCDSLSVTDEPIQGAGGHEAYHQASEDSHAGGKPPMASGMERCLSCMSKLGGHLHARENILSPSWTMELKTEPGVVTRRERRGGGGSYGSGNSDRLSISSHGSGSGCGGGCGNLGDFAVEPSGGRSTHNYPMRHVGHRYSKSRDEGRATPPQTGSHQRGLHSQTRHFCSGSGGENEYAISQDLPSDNYDVPKMLTNLCGNPLCGKCQEVTAIARKIHRDRSSIASSSGSGGQPHDFYDSPRPHPCPNSAHFCGNPHENYDIPPSAIPIALAHNEMTQAQANQRMAGSMMTSGAPSGFNSYNSRVNGEGKMPLVSSSSNDSQNTHRSIPQAQAQSQRNNQQHTIMSMSMPNPTQQIPLVNSNPIYAQVDKTRKQKQYRPLPEPQTSNPNYMNIDYSGGGIGKPALLPPKSGRGGQGNYANLDYSTEERAKEIGMECQRIISANYGHHSPKTEIKSIQSTPKIKGDLTDSAKSSFEEEEPSSGQSSVKGQPLRRSLSVPSKGSGGSGKRGSVSSSDSGVSDGIFFDEGPLPDTIGSLCLHESLPRKSQVKSSTPLLPKEPTSKSKKETGQGAKPKPPQKPNPKPKPEFSGPSPSQLRQVEPRSQYPLRPDLANRHYETIDDFLIKGNGQVEQNSQLQQQIHQNQILLNQQSRHQTFNPQPCNSSNPFKGQPMSPSPQKKITHSTTAYKPRSGSDYCKIDRGAFR